jgi:hypothetical protein
MAWKKKIGGCFGAADFKFGGHSSDRKHARDMLVEAGAANATRASQGRVRVKSDFDYTLWSSGDSIN